MAVPALLAEGMPTTAVEEMEEVAITRDLAGRLAFRAPLGWATVAPTAPVVVGVALGVLEERPFPWRTSSPSMRRMPLQDQCT